MLLGFQNHSLNFSNKNLQGYSFKNQNLTNANFSCSDIQGADFTGANLTNVDFSNAKAGLNDYWIVVSFFLSLLAGFLTGAIAVVICSSLFSNNSDELIAGAIALAGCIAFSIVSLQEGFANAFIKVLGMLAVIGISAGIISVVFNQTVVGNIALFTATNLVLNICVFVLITIFLTFMIAITSTNAVISSLIISVITTISIPLLSTDGIAAVIARNIWFGISINLGITVLLMLLSTDISKRILAGDKNHIFILKIAIATTAIGGTSFRGANLTGANFSGANLRNTDFIKANLIHTIWYRAKKLELARLDQTILDNYTVRDLLVNRKPSKSYENACLEGAYLVDVDLREVNFKNANLRKANLEGANLSKADFTEANLQSANLRAANLEESTFSKTQVIGTDFTQAYFTGACGLGTWNIDSTTKLDGVNCRFVYLGEKPQLEKDGEHCPQSGEFAAGDFTKFFQVVINTVDLIFRDGVDFKILDAAIKSVRAKNQNTLLELQNIENKGDGFVVAKFSVSKEADKAKIHNELKQSYDEQLEAIEAKYQAKLKAKQKKIEKIQEILAEEESQEYQIQAQASKLVVLIIGEGDFANGFPVTAQIWTNDHLRPTTFTSKLPAEPKIPQLYQQWQQLYRSQKWFGRITFDQEDSVTNFSEEELNYYAITLEEKLNNWLNSQQFHLIERGLSSKLIETEEIPIIVQTKDVQLQRLPWHLWDFLKHYPQAEVALSLSGERKEKIVPSKNQIRILTILGNSSGINVEADRKALEKLPGSETVFLVEPSLQQLHQHLWDERGWDILCYSGHSCSQTDGSTGTMLLNQTKLLTIKELKHALTKAIERGLQLAIFNSCDGLGLARELADLHIPQMIVMREPVPDKVAQEFLKYFLSAFSSGKSLYSSVREARLKLEILQDEFPYATWLPVIFQNSAEVGMSWGKL